MAIKEEKRGTVIFRAGQTLDQLCIITKGTVKMLYSGGELVLEKGDCIGLSDIYYGTHSFNLVTMEDTTLLVFPYQKVTDLKAIMASGKDIAELLIHSITNQACELLDQFLLSQFECNNTFEYLKSCNSEYRQLCVRYLASYKELPGFDEITPLILEEDIDSWVCDFYDGVKEYSSAQLQALFASPEICIGYMMSASKQIHHSIEVCQIMTDYRSELSSFFLNENHLDFFDLYTGLLFKALKSNVNTLSLSASISKLLIQIESFPSINKSLYKSRVSEYRNKLNSHETSEEIPSAVSAEVEKNNAELSDSLSTILHYSDCTEEKATAFKKSISQYKKQMDKNSLDDEVRMLRRIISTQFYEVYKDVFLISLSDKDIPPVIKMFLLFGYVDEELAGMENAAYLRTLSEYKGDESLGVYTFYEWLIQIYQGKKEPCRNEFDLDFGSYVHEMKTTGKITDEMENRMLNDRAQKVMFEIQNVFPIVNKITFGRAASFCPVFSEHNVFRSLDSVVVMPEIIKKAETTIRNIDFSAYFRETVFASPVLGTSKEFIQVEILPDVILTPTIGTRGVMWQEIEGKRRNTPARMMLPIFSLEDISNIFIRLTGEYRWEMCKRIQGGRWNDYTELSLTSEYFDYIQFYKKNHDLSTDAKDKIKLGLQKAKNNFKEMFVQDYIIYILYEGLGSPRLNRVARKILFDYCPFPKELRTQLSNSPMYKEQFDRYNIHMKSRLHRMDNLFTKIKNSGAQVPVELENQREFLAK